eukprot:scaffold2364_cov51-Phaeocystis_antarctica.AAC.3
MMLPHPVTSELAQLPAFRIEGHTQPAEANLPRSTSSAASVTGAFCAASAARCALWAAASASACRRAA